jgi:hypothetical protein
MSYRHIASPAARRAYAHLLGPARLLVSELVAGHRAYGKPLAELVLPNICERVIDNQARMDGCPAAAVRGVGVPRRRSHSCTSLCAR